MTHFINVSGDESKPLYIDAHLITHVTEHIPYGKQTPVIVIDTIYGAHELFVDTQEYKTTLDDVARKVSEAGTELVQINSITGLGDAETAHINFIAPQALNYISVNTNLYNQDKWDIHVGIRGSQFSGTLNVEPSQVRALMRSFFEAPDKNIMNLGSENAYFYTKKDAYVFLDASRITSIAVDSSKINVIFDHVSSPANVSVRPDPSKTKEHVSFSLVEQFEERQADVDLARKIAAQCPQLVEFPANKANYADSNPNFITPTAYFLSPEHYSSIEYLEHTAEADPNFHLYEVLLEQRGDFRTMMGEVRIRFKTPEEREQAIQKFFENCQNRPAFRPQSKRDSNPKFKL